MKSIGSRLTRRITVITLAFALIGALMPIAGAAPDHKQFTATLDQSVAVAGMDSTLTLKVTHTSKNTKLGAFRLDVPGAFEVLGTGSIPDWTVTVENGDILAIANKPPKGLDPGKSLTLTIDVRNPLQNGDTTYDFGIEARQANHFKGAGNDLNYVGGPLALTITGSAVACSGSSCSTSFNENVTALSVVATCQGSNCGILTADLGNEYCRGNESCADRAAFWNPPAGAKGFVEITLTIPKHEVDGKPKFFIAKTIDDKAKECGSKKAALKCTYKVTKKHGKWIIKAWVEAGDPRGFVS